MLNRLSEDETRAAENVATWLASRGFDVIGAGGEGVTFRHAQDALEVGRELGGNAYQFVLADDFSWARLLLTPAMTARATALATVVGVAPGRA